MSSLRCLSCLLPLSIWSGVQTCAIGDKTHLLPLPLIFSAVAALPPQYLGMLFSGLLYASLKKLLSFMSTGAFGLWSNLPWSCKQGFLKLWWAIRSPGNPVKCRFWCYESGEGLRVCISNKLPDGAQNPWTTLWVVRVVHFCPAEPSQGQWWGWGCEHWKNWSGIHRGHLTDSPRVLTSNNDKNME